MKFAPHYIHISITEQKLSLINHGKNTISYPVSTAKNGVGETMGSECTPRGWHKIRAKIGDNQPLNAVFVGRRPSEEVYSASLAKAFPDRDWILTRILWLAGLEPGKNRYGRVDSSWRYIYIHGCPNGLITGKAESHGCIRMKNEDVLDLYSRVKTGITVFVE
ncbi:MAG: L,D-transpeptidase [Methylococcales symbiont of Hymedesmia sp. n. MRB-2018]|nr:MAG: L,D-transpeptidase [Methylococcales symbiont of Hymedesmia sp. n. MRB-2018]KAF3984200.1 MAG: L,D-transpeptidase [Methylococcales symbiont of Hymedesmia sp. n. MRB-2018]